jgi:hypothetical protein
VSSEGSAAAGPERWLVLPAALRRACNWGALAVGAGALAWLLVRWKLDPISSVMMTFLGICLVRQTLLDALLRRRAERTTP